MLGDQARMFGYNLEDKRFILRETSAIAIGITIGNKLAEFSEHNEGILQSFEEIRDKDVFCVDKTGFIKEWWENGDSVTLITRPRRFVKNVEPEYGGMFFF